VFTITTAQRGSAADASCRGFMATGRNRAEAISELLKQLEKNFPKEMGQPWEAPDCALKGTLGTRMRTARR